MQDSVLTIKGAKVLMLRYDEVLPECTYNVGRNKIDSPDVLMKKGNQICFIDTKLSTPNLEIRKFNYEMIEKTVSRYANNIIQMYNRIKEFKDGYYYPFNEKVSIESSNVFGIVALLEDSYISRRQIYAKVFSKLGIEDSSEEAKYIQSHIKITNFSDLERFAFRSHNIFVALVKKEDNPWEWNDMGLFAPRFYEGDVCEKLPSLEAFVDKSKNRVLETVEEFVQLGLIKKD